MEPTVFTPLDDLYLVVSFINSARYLYIHDLRTSEPTSDPRPLCTLELPGGKPGKFFMRHMVSTSDYATHSGGHFRVDPSSSMVIVTVLTLDNYGRVYTSYLLIPYTTLSARIRTAELSRPADLGGARESPLPWDDWGPRGCLLLRVQPELTHIRAVPFGSRMPLVAFEGPDVQRPSVYVFDVNPLAARRARLRAHDDEATAIVEDIETVFPGVVDPECAAIPYIVYRFELPLEAFDRHAIRSVEMHTTGFTVTVSNAFRPLSIFLNYRALTGAGRWAARVSGLRSHRRPGRSDILAHCRG